MSLDTVPTTGALLTEETVQDYERLVPIAAAQVACLRRGDLSGFETLLEQKERLIDRVRARVGDAPEVAVHAALDAPARDARLAGRAETAIRSVLASEEQALAILLAAREQVSTELSGLTRGGVGLKAYGARGAGSESLDRTG